MRQSKQTTKHANSPVVHGKECAVSVSVVCVDARAAVKGAGGFVRLRLHGTRVRRGSGRGGWPPAPAQVTRGGRDAIRPAIRRSRAAASWSVLLARPAAASCVSAASDSTPTPDRASQAGFLPRGSAPCLFLRGGDTPDSNRKGSASVRWFGLRTSCLAGP
jgi:hypothetical protein